MSQVYRKEVTVNERFSAPADITFGYQSHRCVLSVWYLSTDLHTKEYIVVPTGIERAGLSRIVSTVCVDGFHVFHLCEVQR